MGFLISDVSDNRRNVGSAYAVALSLVAPACPERSRRASCRLFALSRCPSTFAFRTAGVPPALWSSPLIPLFSQTVIPLALRYEASAVEGLHCLSLLPSLF